MGAAVASIDARPENLDPVEVIHEIVGSPPAWTAGVLIEIPTHDAKKRHERNLEMM